MTQNSLSSSIKRELGKFIQFSRLSTRLIIAIFLLISSLCFFYSYPLSLLDSSNTISSLLSSSKQHHHEEPSPPSNVLQHLIQTEGNEESHTIFKHPDEESLNLLDFDRSRIKYIYPEVIDSIYDHVDLDTVDWSKYAYVLYATSSNHMCNAMMIFGELRKFKTRATLVLLVKEEFLTEPEKYPSEHETLTKFSKDYDVILRATKVIKLDNDGVQIWTSSFTKLMLFNETDYERVIYMDSDGLLTKGNLDELFFLPPCKLAVTNGYWITDERFGEVEDLASKYQEYTKEEVLTERQRSKKIARFINEHIDAYADENNQGRLPIRNAASTSVDHLDELEKIANEKNFYTNIYNDLPSFLTVDEFYLTSILMVVQPSKEIFSNVLQAIKDRDEGEFDMDLVQNRLFNVKKIPDIQRSNSITNKPELEYNERSKEIPEILIIPSKVYGTLTIEMNSKVKHGYYMVDSHEQVLQRLSANTSNSEPPYYDIEWMEKPGDFYFKDVKYVHFSDAPIPKPWFKQKPNAEYMTYRTRCPTHPDFLSESEDIRKPRNETPDCSNAKNWEAVHMMFREVRREVCRLDLINTDADTYNGIIN